jgi:carbon monoxide dehydrogenase subunit G
VDLQHTFTVPIPIDAAWAAFTDIERIAPCLPGAVITSVDGDEFTGTAKVKLGPIALQYGGKGVWVSKDDATYSAVIDAQGKDKRGNGTAGAVIKAHLEELPEGTKVVMDTELKITGRPAQFGRGVIQDVGGKILDQFATCLATRLGPEGDAATAEAVAATAAGGAGAAAPASAEADGETDGAAARASAVADASAAFGAGAPTEAAAAPAASPGPARPAAVPAARPTPVEPIELDLGNVVGPVLLKRVAPIAGAAVVVAVIVWLVTRN